MKILFALVAAASAASVAAQSPTPAATTYANRFDQAVAGRYEQRESDWRNGAVV